MANAQIEGLGLELVKVQRALLALLNLENLAAVKRVIGDSDLAPPSFGLNVNRLPGATHNFSLVMALRVNSASN